MSDSYIVRLERLRVELRDILRDKGFALSDDVDLTTMIPKVEGIGDYEVIKAMANNSPFAINDTEGEFLTIGTDFFAQKKLTSLSLPEVTTITAGNAFYNCQQLTSISLPKCTNISGGNAFGFCGSLTDINIPVIQNLAYEAFRVCTSLLMIDLPESLTTINNGKVFDGCSKLNTVILRYTGGVVTLSSPTSVFGGTPFNNGEGGTLYVPDNLVSSYQADTNWSSLASITVKGLSEL